MGHFRLRCPKLKKFTTESKKTAGTSSNPKKDSGSRTASAVEELSSDEEGAWATYEIMNEEVSDEDWFKEAIREDGGMPKLIKLSERKEEDNIEMPELEEVSDSEDEKEDGMPELVELSESEDDKIESMADMDILVVVEEIDEEDVDALKNAPEEVLVSTKSMPTTETAELYDSRCTNHISPYKDQFQNFENIAPRHFRAANKQSFSTIGKGDMVINVPNGPNTSQLHLTDVLYLPEVNYTLISIGRLDESGFTVTFGGGKCTPHGPDGVKVGEVLRRSSRI